MWIDDAFWHIRHDRRRADDLREERLRVIEQISLMQPGSDHPVIALRLAGRLARLVKIQIELGGIGQ